MRPEPLIAAVVVAILLAACDPSMPIVEDVGATDDGGPVGSGIGENCTNRTDDDGDGQVDCADLECLAPARDEGDFESSFGFLAEGGSSGDCVAASPQGALAGSIDLRRLAVVRGRVQHRDTGLPIADAEVFARGHPGWGRARTDATGHFVFAVEAGRSVLDVEASGLIPNQRVVAPPVHGFAWAGEIAMTPFDGRSTLITFGSDRPQTHVASVTRDESGSRSVRLVFPSREHASVRGATGTRDVDSLTIRATELTVGSRGPTAMVGTLPSASAYTYAVEVTADEVDPRTESIELDRPVSVFVDNFLAFDVGTIVPVGSYDRSRGRWVAEPNGAVVEVLGSRDGRALVDTDGDGAEDPFPEDAAFALLDQPAGTQLTWFEARHFSIFDPNFPASLPPGTRPLFIAATNSTLLSVTPAGVVSVVGGRAGVFASSGDGGGLADARFRGLAEVAAGADGSLYLADGGTCIRQAAITGVVSTFAGRCDGTFGDGGDGGPAANASFGAISALAVASDGFVYVGDRLNRRVRRIRPDGVIEGFAGGGRDPDSEDAASVAFVSVDDIAISPAGDVIIAVGDGLVSVGESSGAWRVARIAGDPDGAPAFREAPAATARLDAVRAVTVNGEGEICFPSGSHAEITVWCVRPDRGLLRDVAGGGVIDASDLAITRRSVRANSARFASIDSIAVTSDGGLALSQVGLLYRMAPALPRMGPVDSNLTVVPDPAGGVTWTFDPQGRHVATRDIWTGDEMLAVAWGPRGLEEVTDADGLALTIERDSSQVRIVPPFGPETVLTTEGNGYLHTVTDSLGGAYSATHGPDGLLTTFAKPDGAESRFQFVDGRLVSDSLPNGAEIMLSRGDDAGRERVTVTGPRIDEREQIGRERSRATGSTSAMSPDGAGATSTIDESGDEVVEFSDGSHIERHISSDPLFGAFIPYVSAATFRLPSGFTASVTQTVDAGSRTTPYGAPPTMRTLTFAGATFTTSWSPETRTHSLHGGGEELSTMTLDAQGRPETISRPGLATLTYTYGTDGSLSRVAASDGLETRDVSFEYAGGRLRRTTAADGSSIELRRDGGGRVQSWSRPDGAVVSLRRDAMDRVIGITPPDEGEQTVSFSPTGALQSFGLPGGPELAHGLDLGSAVVSTRVGDRRFEITRSPSGSVETVTLGRGLHRVVRDSAGLVHSIVGPGSHIDLDYDGPFVRRLSYGGALSASVSFEPDGGLLIGAWETAGLRVEVTRDEQRRVTQVGEMTVRYRPGTGLIEASVVGEVDTSYVINAFAETERRTTTRAGTVLFDEQVLARDALGRITREATTSVGVTRERTYHYDVLGRLDRVDEDGATIESIEYTANGSRVATTRSGVRSTTDLGAAEQVLRAGETTFEYLNDGSRSVRTSSSGRREYVVDEVGTLEAVVREDGSRVTYELDPLGRRIGQLIDGARIRGFYYVGPFLPIAEVDATGTVQSIFVHAPHEHGPAYMVRDGERYVFVKDIRGSVRLVVRESDGAVAQELDYDAWGRILRDTNPGFQPFGYAAGLYDSETGLVRFGAREYDPETGTFLSPDPGLLDGGLNPYAYAAGDPIQLVDPNGENPLAVIVLVGAEAAMTGYFARAWSRDAIDAQLQGCWRGVSWREVATDFAVGAATAGLGSYLAGTPEELVVDTIEQQVAGAGRRGCFAAGTVVETDGGPRPIEDIRAGDRVWALTETTGEWGYFDVLDTSVHSVDRVVALDVGPSARSVERLEATPEHPFWSRDGWTPASALRPGDEIFTSRGGWIRVHGSTWVSREQLVYNLDVEDADSFFVGASGMWVHNACWSPGKVGSGPRNAYNHWLSHGTDFPHYNSATEYVRGAHEFFRERAEFATRTRLNGQIVVFDPATERFGVFAPDGTPSTFYVPNPTVHGYTSNLDYFLFGY